MNYDIQPVIGRLVEKHGSLAQAALHVGVHVNTLYNMEHGKHDPSLRTFLKICAELGEHPALVMQEIVECV